MSDDWIENFNVLTTDTEKTLKIKKLKLYPKFNWWNAKLKEQINKISALKKSTSLKWKIILNKERALYEKNNKNRKIKIVAKSLHTNQR